MLNYTLVIPPLNQNNQCLQCNAYYESYAEVPKRIFNIQTCKNKSSGSFLWQAWLILLSNVCILFFLKFLFLMYWESTSYYSCAKNAETKEEVAIKKIGNAFENRIDAKRTLREIKLLSHMDHDNVFKLTWITVQDIFFLASHIFFKICTFNLMHFEQQLQYSQYSTLFSL